MIIFPCVANDTGGKILHSLDPIQVVFRSVAPDITTVIERTENYGIDHTVNSRLAHTPLLRTSQ